MSSPRHPHGPERSERPFLDTVRLRRLNRWQAEGLREDLADLYVESSVTPPGEEFRGRQEFLRRLEHDVQLPGFDMLVAEAVGLTGCVSGIPVPRDGSWWEGFDGPMPQNLEQLTASGHVFAILKPSSIRTGTPTGSPAGSRSGCSPTTSPRSVSPWWIGRPLGLCRLQGLGWQEAGQIHRPPGPTALSVLVLPLGERTEDHPDGLAHNDRTQRPE